MKSLKYLIVILIITIVSCNDSDESVKYKKRETPKEEVKEDINSIDNINQDSLIDQNDSILSDQVEITDEINNETNLDESTNEVIKEDHITQNIDKSDVKESSVSFDNINDTKNNTNLEFNQETNLDEENTNSVSKKDFVLIMHTDKTYEEIINQSLRLLPYPAPVWNPTPFSLRDNSKFLDPAFYWWWTFRKK